jgi:integrase
VHLIPAIGEYELEELTLPVLQSFIVELGKSGNKLRGCGLEPSTTGVIVSVLQRSLKFAFEIGISTSEHTAHLKRPKIRQKSIECFTVTEQKKIEGYLLSRRVDKKLGVLICLYTGLRIGELLALKWTDVDAGYNFITVNATCRDVCVNGAQIRVISTPKTATSRRIIPVPKQLKQYLKALKKISKSEFVISGNSEREVSVRSYQKMFSTLLNQLGIKHRGFHSLRHTFATRALECGMDVRTLAEVMGHKNPQVTLNRYAHSMIEHKIAMMNRVGKSLQ